ncbi:metal-dependent hydrolase family protein [Streptomyces adonidis]|uniref:metal-dependent hydrolase family protein n=1 Tax=Streptomyces adonidis TaxID=3231367 RepID=UPI0034DB6209
MTDSWLLLTGGRVIDGLGNPPVDDCAVLVRGDRIHAIGPAARADAVPRGEPLLTLDVTGRTVMPGLIDVHCHMTYGESRTEEEIDLYTSPERRTLLAAHNATKVLRAGVTSISQPGGSYFIGVGIRDGIRDGLVHGPRMTTAGRYLTTSNGLTDWYPDSVGVPAGNIGTLTNTVDQMREEIRHQVKNGVDLIKCADSPYGEYQAFTDDEMKAIADLTHQLRKKVTIHARGAAEVRAAARAGFDWIMHGNVLDDAAIEALAETGTPLVPTLLLLANMADYRREAEVPAHQADAVKRMLDKTADSLHRAREAGVRFAVGTDSGFAVTAYGEWHARELQLLKDYAGLTSLEAIQAGTSGCAGMMNLEGQVGAVAEGMLADLIVADGDPSRDLGVLVDPARILHVILGGVVQEFDEDLRSQIYQHDRQPHEYSYKRLTYEMVVGDGTPAPATDVPWEAGQRADLVTDARRIEKASRRAAREAYTDEFAD